MGPQGKTFLFIKKKEKSSPNLIKTCDFLLKFLAIFVAVLYISCRNYRRRWRCTEVNYYEKTQLLKPIHPCTGLSYEFLPSKNIASAWNQRHPCRCSADAVHGICWTWVCVPQTHYWLTPGRPCPFWIYVHIHAHRRVYLHSQNLPPAGRKKFGKGMHNFKRFILRVIMQNRFKNTRKVRMNEHVQFFSINPVVWDMLFIQKFVHTVCIL